MATLYLGSKVICPVKVISPGTPSQLTVVPKTTSQIFRSYNPVYNNVTLSGVTSDIDSNIKPTNIRSGITILGVPGTYVGTIPAYSIYKEINAAGKLTNTVGFIDLTDINTIGDYALSYGYYHNTNLTGAIDLSDIVNIAQYGLLYCFAYTGITSINLNSLSVIGAGSLIGCFAHCTNLTCLYFPSLTEDSFGTYTNQFDNMLEGVTGCEVHFPENLSYIYAWASVQNGFGGTNTHVYFDLPAYIRAPDGDLVYDATTGEYVPAE